MKNQLRYVLAILAVSLAVLLRYALVPLIGPGLPYVTLFPITVSVALLAGFGPAILTGILGGVAVDYLFIPPLFTAPLDAGHLARLTIVALTSAFVGYVGDRLRTARAKAEGQARALQKSERVMQARFRILKAAYADEASVDEVLQVTLDEIETQTGSVIGFYHFLESDQETLSLQNWSSNTVATMCTAEGKGSHYNISQAGVWVDCVHKKRPIIHNDYASLSHRKGLPQGHAPVIREMVVPILRGDRIVAIIGVGNKPTDYTSTDIEIARLLGDFSWEIVERKWAEEELRKAHSELEIRVQERTAELARTNEELEGEITERTKAELRISRLNRLYSVLSKANEAIVRIHDPEALYVQLCRIAVEDGLSKMAWIGLTDSDTRKVEVAASFGDTGGYLDGIKIYAAVVPEGKGPTGKAAFEGNYSICSDIEHDPRMAPWRDKALGHGFRSSAAFPLRMGQAVIGAFTIYSDKLQFFTDEEIKLLSSLAEDVSFAIESMANESKRLKAEEALRMAYVYNRSLLEASLDPLVTIDADGKITDVNIATENVTGQTREDLIGTDFSDYFTQRDKARAGYQQVFSKGLVKDYSLEIRHRDGHITPVLYNAAVYRDETGRVIGVFAAARDITKRRETERRTAVTNSLLKLYTLKFSRKEYLEAAVELIRQWSGCRYVGIRIPDQDGNIPFAACAGYGSLFLSTEATLSLERDRCLCTRVIEGEPQLQELNSMTPNGSFYLNDALEFQEGLTREQKKQYRGVCIRNGLKSLALIPIQHRDKIVGAIHLADEQEDLFTLDKIEFIEQMAFIIGEAMFRFGIEEELQKLNKELEERVADRTARLEAANRELDAFSYSVSHDLRAPLRSIDGFSQALLEDYWEKLDDDGRDFLKRVRAGSQRMGQLIDDLLKLSRVTRSDMSRGLVNLSDLANRAADELRYTQPDRKVEFIIAEGVTAEGDDGLLFLVIENLISNAWKFTGKNPEAKIEFGALEPEMWNADPGVASMKPGWPDRPEIEGKTIYYVRDNGIGFDMSYSVKLGMPFQRLHSTTEFPGTGIGLATVKRIINRHGGTLWMEGEVGKGATVYFTL